QGSGFIISKDGYILTNNHVVDEAKKLTVKFSDGQELKAEIVGTDPDADVAVIKVDGKDLAYLELADSDEAEVGQWVVAIGNPFGLNGTVTAGIVSAKGRSRIGLNKYEDFIQTDAAINRGNSGGPLLNLDGKVIGINTAIIGSTGNIGIGLAIPINMAKYAYEQIIAGGKVERGYLGVGIQNFDKDLAKSFELGDTKGVLISEVTEGSAADKAGIKQGDIVIEFNGQPVDDRDAFRNRVAMLQPGTKADIVVLRNGERKTLKVKLSKRSEEELTGEVVMETLGIAVENLTEDLAERLGYEGLTGVVISKVKPDSIAASVGLRTGVLVQEVDRKPIKNVKDFEKAIAKAKKEKAVAVLLLISNGRYSQFLVLKFEDK
ncbi:MAG: Do family serine endopeptidase, partial [Planctomycetota bacterium]